MCAHILGSKRKGTYSHKIIKKKEIRQQSECMPSQQKINNNKQIIGHHN
jgi:hypothetical protein